MVNLFLLQLSSTALKLVHFFKIFSTLPLMIYTFLEEPVNFEFKLAVLNYSRIFNFICSEFVLNL